MKAEIFNTTHWVTITEPKILVQKLEAILKEAEFEIVGFTEHYFEIQGYTCVWIISESHLAVHTFPEENKTYIELSSCNKMKNDHFNELMENLSS